VLPIAQLGTLGLAPFVAASGDVPLGLAMAVTALAGWAVQVGTLVRSYATGGVPRRAALLYPLGCFIVGRIMLTAARDLRRGTPLVWGQRHYVLKPR
jgi:predicted MFS family arabinose efflux permease